MYATCIFCNAALGRNDTVEAFPVGRRLAFDAAKGRLWVVCPRCERWNLTPLEERWEAIETCERRYRDTRQRVTTDNVGLARVDDGLELIRIGAPLRPELAAWRYGDQFGRRRRQRWLRIGGGAVAGVAVVAGGPLLGVAAGGVLTATSLLVNVWAMAWARRGSVVLPHPEEGRILLTTNQLPEIRLIPRADEYGWALEVPYAAHERHGDNVWQRFKRYQNNTDGRVTLHGAAAERAAGVLLPRINGGGATAPRVREAVQLIEQASEPARFFASAAGRTREWGHAQLWGDTGALRFLPQPVRLALEMAAHEDAERRALQGELAELEAAWRDAEAIAAIADDLLLPERVRAKWRELRGDGAAARDAR